MLEFSKFGRLIQGFRPPESAGELDPLLPGIAETIRKELGKIVNTLEYPACRLDSKALDLVSAAIVGFGEDIHCGAGLWEAIEGYEREFYGRPAPLFVGRDEESPTGFDPRRIRSLIYTLWPWLQPEYHIAPDHQDLCVLAQRASEILTESFQSLPKDSGVVRLLQAPYPHVGDLKKKLVWLGTMSYLFRNEFAEYATEMRRDETIVDTTDRFVCEKCTRWSGLGAIDVLAAALELPEPDRTTLRSWYEVHESVYRIDVVKPKGPSAWVLKAVNLINDERYNIRLEMADCPFTPKLVVYGRLVPWKGTWYWSGAQRSFGHLDARTLAEFRKKFLQEQSAIAYRFRPDLAEKARKMVQEQFKRFVADAGDDLVVYPDGHAAAAAERERVSKMFKAASSDARKNAMKRHHIEEGGPTVSFPDEFLESKGVAAFFDPTEGIEYLHDFDHTAQALEKKGKELTDDESERIYGLIEDPEVSPAFVKRLVRKYGAESIGSAYRIEKFEPELHLDYLLRCFKGKYYRKRYPNISFVE